MRQQVPTGFGQSRFEYQNEDRIVKTAFSSESAENRGLTSPALVRLTLFGNYIPGLCFGLSVSTKDLGKPLSKEKYPVITTRFTSDIKVIYDVAHKAFAYAPAWSGYINKCDLCTEIRTVMIDKNFGGVSEFNPREFYRKPK
ncbi:MAG: hypothetical protein U9N83_12510 [Thermodesulfobacteriota bacterium]|nr:hypothetical protein [Thermodesulfobacteriota bacterium]